jgi:hypothetical protein
MRKLLGALLVALLALLALGTALATASPSLDSEYLGFIRSEGVYIPSYKEPITIQLGHEIVAYLDVHPTDAGVESVGRDAYEAGVDAHTAAVIIVAAVYVYEPSLLPVLQHYVAHHGGGSSEPVVIVGYHKADDPGITQIVCMQYLAGVPPAQIAEGLHNGMHLPMMTAAQLTWTAIFQCQNEQ